MRAFVTRTTECSETGKQHKLETEIYLHDETTNTCDEDWDKSFSNEIWWLLTLFGLWDRWIDRSTDRREIEKSITRSLIYFLWHSYEIFRHFSTVLLHHFSIKTVIGFIAGFFCEQLKKLEEVHLFCVDFCFNIRYVSISTRMSLVLVCLLNNLFCFWFYIFSKNK